MSKHEQRVKTVFRTMDDHAYDKMRDLFVDDVDMRMGAQTFPGLAPFREMVAGWYVAFPDLQHTVVEYLEDGDRAACTIRVTGTHTGPLRTPNGDVPATGKRITFDAIDSVRFGADGKAVSWHVYFDMVPFLEQLGLA